eukprot:snap_masked-scaffold_52-processed-gene-0.28-mRNA-1 protein AED:0.03 eAED:0.03 QI:0/-1/0/1/-1/1/1/0/320
MIQIADILALLFILYFLHIVAKVLNAFRIRFLLSGKSFNLYGKYVVVTGATDGIAKELVFQLAQQNASLILISRTKEKLENLRQEILSLKSYDGDVKVLAIDFSQISDVGPSGKPEIYEEVEKMFEEVNEELGVLVNNVGKSYDFPMYFHELSFEEISDLVSVNVTSTNYMTRLFLDQVLKKKNKRKGAVVNIGSYAGVLASPLLSEYSASKAYIERLTKGLDLEYRSEGVEFQCHVPLFIVSKLSKIRKSSLTVPSAESYAKSVLDYLGKPVCIVSGNFVHSVLTQIALYMPRSLYYSMVKKSHLAIRKRGMRKRERTK